MREKQTIDQLIKVSEIYHEPTVMDFARGREILERFPDAERHEVPSHWKIPHLHGFEGSAENWLQIKRNVLILGVKKSLTARANSRSSHFIAPSHSNGCTMSCVYCYVPRRKGFANPITLFYNIEQILGYLERHAGRQGIKSEPDHIDPEYWVYEIGENSDVSVDAALCDNVKDLVELFRDLPNAKLTFATKFVNRDMLEYDPRKKTRIRFSLMPQRIAKVIDVRTSLIKDRIGAINDFYDAGYEVHVNFAPVVYYEGWYQDYGRLLEELDDSINDQVKDQLACEVIFLTHNTNLHDVNMTWHPKGESLLWKPDLQETKYSQTGGRNLRYKRNLKADLVDQLKELIEEKMPYCRIRYAF